MQEEQTDSRITGYGDETPKNPRKSLSDSGKSRTLAPRKSTENPENIPTMPIIRCRINGLTHCRVADQLDTFMDSVTGRRVVLKAEQENEHDPLAIAAYVGVRKVGYVSQLTQAEAWAGLRGTGKPTLHGRVVETTDDPKTLIFETSVPHRADVSELYSPAAFAAWRYTGPCLPKSEEQETVEVAAYELLEMIAAGETGDEADEVFRTFMQLTRYDLSAEMSDLRGQIVTALERSGCEPWQEAARQLRRLCSEMGRTDMRREMAHRITDTLPHSREARRMMSRARHVDLEQIRRELEALPHRLYDDYLTDPVLFASRLSYAHIPWQKLNELLSAIVVLRLADEMPDRKQAEGGEALRTGAVAADGDAHGPKAAEVGSFLALVTRPEQASAVVARLHVLMEHQLKPRDILMPIRAAMDAGALKRPTWRQFCAEFGRNRVSGKSSFSSYTNIDNIPYVGESFLTMTAEFRSLIAATR